MAKKKVQKKKAVINVRTLTTWISVGVFFLLACIIGFTVWFVSSTLETVGNPPTLSDANQTGRVESINVKLLKSVEENLEEKTSRTISSPGGRRNPFNIVAPTPEPVPPPEESPIPEPAAE